MRTVGGDQASYQIQLLGEFAVSAGGRSVIDRSWTRRKAQALIKFLALQKDGRLHREQVVDLLWPRLTLDDAANNLYKNLHYVRRACCEAGETRPLIQATNNMVELAEGTVIDIDGFSAAAERARAARRDAQLYEDALSIYRGDLLPEDLYEEWTEPRRHELFETRNRLLLEVSRLYDDQRRFDLAIDRLEALIHADSLHEQAHLRLMMIFVASGKRDRALRQYQYCRKAYARELSAPPSEEIETLYQQILNRASA